MYVTNRGQVCLLIVQLYHHITLVQHHPVCILLCMWHSLDLLNTILHIIKVANFWLVVDAALLLTIAKWCTEAQSKDAVLRLDRASQTRIRWAYSEGKLAVCVSWLLSLYPLKLKRKPYHYYNLAQVPDSIPRPDYSFDGVPRSEIESRQQRTGTTKDLS